MNRQLFEDGDLQSWLWGRRSAITEKVRQENPEKLLGVDTQAYQAYLLDCFRLAPIQLDLDRRELSEREELIPADRFRYGATDGRPIPKQVVTIHIPYTGTEELFSYTPNPRLMRTFSYEVTDHEIRIPIINFDESEARLRQQIDHECSDLSAQVGHIARQVQAHVSQLPMWIAEDVEKRRAEILARRGTLANLSIPIRRSANVPQTFAIPVQRKTLRVQKPEASSAPFTPEPTIAEEMYREIVRILFELGRQMEKTPSVYRDRDEEALRDQFLLGLSPHFESATGETFNRGGKTDILVRHEGGTAFVGECKFWTGPAAYPEIIDQILRYLTWRDSKAAILLFVRNKDLNGVLGQIDPLTRAHSAFKSQVEARQDEGRFRYRLGLPQDPNRIVHLTVLVFHFTP